MFGKYYSIDVDGNELDIKPIRQLEGIVLQVGVLLRIGYLAGRVSNNGQIVNLNRG